VAADVGGDVFCVEVGAGGDGPDDVAGATDRQPLPAAVEQQRGAGVGAGPAGAFVEPGLQVGAQLGVDRQVARGGALAADAQGAFPGGQAHVVGVECDGLADAQPGVDRQQ